MDFSKNKAANLFDIASIGPIFGAHIFISINGNVIQRILCKHRSILTILFDTGDPAPNGGLVFDEAAFCAIAGRRARLKAAAIEGVVPSTLSLESGLFQAYSGYY